MPVALGNMQPGPSSNARRAGLPSVVNSSRRRCEAEVSAQSSECRRMDAQRACIAARWRHLILKICARCVCWISHNFCLSASGFSRVPRFTNKGYPRRNSTTRLKTTLSTWLKWRLTIAPRGIVLSMCVLRSAPKAYSNARGTSTVVVPLLASEHTNRMHGESSSENSEALWKVSCVAVMKNARIYPGKSSPCLYFAMKYPSLLSVTLVSGDVHNLADASKLRRL